MGVSAFVGIWLEKARPRREKCKGKSFARAQGEYGEVSLSARWREGR